MNLVPLFFIFCSDPDFLIFSIISTDLSCPLLTPFPRFSSGFASHFFFIFVLPISFPFSLPWYFLFSFCLLLCLLLNTDHSRLTIFSPFLLFFLFPFYSSSFASHSHSIPTLFYPFHLTAFIFLFIS